MHFNLLAGAPRSEAISRTASHRRRKLRSEPLEDRLLLAQTTGLFYNEPEAANGYVLFSPNTTTSTYLMDKNANIVNQWQSGYLPGLLAELLPDNSLLRASALHGPLGNGSINAAGAGGLLERFNWEGDKIWEFTYDDSTHLAHHDFEPLPNGNVLLIAWELKSEGEADAAGRDPSLPGPGFLYPDHIVEVEPDLVDGVGGEIVWEWHLWDHLVQEFNSTLANWQGPTGVEDHPELVDINFVSTFDEGAADAQDWTHANGIAYNAELDQILLSVREFSEFWIIDHSTTTEQAETHSGGNSGKGGDLLYRWGNPQAYDRGNASNRILFYQHDAKWVPAGMPGAGNITVFNNGVGRTGDDFTTIEEITPPVDINGNYSIAAGQPFGPTATTWTYPAPPENYSAIISGTQRLPNGNTLITYGVNGTFIEITPAEEQVWKYVNPYIAGRTLLPMETIDSLGGPGPLLGSLKVNFTFRSIHYPVNYVTKGIADVNDDGYVDGADYTVWADHFLTTVTGGKFAGDFNLDDVVDAGDYTLWADNYLPTPPPAATVASSLPSKVKSAHQEASDSVVAARGERAALTGPKVDLIEGARSAIAWAALIDRLASTQDLIHSWSQTDLGDEWVRLAARFRNRLR